MYVLVQVQEVHDCENIFKTLDCHRSLSIAPPEFSGGGLGQIISDTSYFPAGEGVWDTQEFYRRLNIWYGTLQYFSVGGQLFGTLQIFWQEGEIIRDLNPPPK